MFEMPLYEYKCERCGARFEAIARIAEKDETACPECGAPAERQLSSFAVGSAESSDAAKSCFKGG
jgi:putative FmdB family regulatory protein